MRYTQSAYHCTKRIIFSSVYFDLVDMNPPLSSMLSTLRNLLLLCFLLFRGGVLQVPRTCLCFAVLRSPLLVYQENIWPPHMWRCQGGLSERSSSFWCLQLSTNPDSSLPSPYLPGVRKTTLASRTLARTQLNLQHSSDNTSQSERDELVRRACLRACYKV